MLQLSHKSSQAYSYSYHLCFPFQTQVCAIPTLVEMKVCAWYTATLSSVHVSLDGQETDVRLRSTIVSPAHATTQTLGLLAVLTVMASSAPVLLVSLEIGVRTTLIIVTGTVTIFTVLNL